VSRFMRLMRAGLDLVPCSQMIRRPSRSKVIPLDMFEGCLTVMTSLTLALKSTFRMATVL
jgi:hypothetical protein